jgi:chromosome segregation ATPase
MEAKWQRGHKEIMEFEEKKNKLLSEIEVLTTQKNELVKILGEIRKEVEVHGGDYNQITQERIKITNELDEKLIKLKEETEQNSIKQANLFKTINNLQNLIKELEEKEKAQEETKNKNVDEIEKLTSIINEFKIAKQSEVEEKNTILSNLKDELKKTKDELKQHRKEMSEKKSNILKEERLLSIKRSDLEIYEARMRKKYPNETFVLKQDAIITSY